MFHSQAPRRIRVHAVCCAVVLGIATPGLLNAQNPSNPPAIQPPQPVPANTLPSMPPAVPAERSQQIGTPSQASPQNPSGQQPVSPAQPAPGQNTTQQNTNPNYQNPLDKPVTVPPPGQVAQPAPVSIAPPTTVASLPSIPTDYTPPVNPARDHLGSTYIPDDDEVYPMALRLYSMGYLDTIFISMRPWTRRSLLHALEESGPAIQADGNEQAMEIYAKLMDYLQIEIPGPEGTTSSAMTRGQVYGVDTLYARAMGIAGQTLRDSYHLGQTIVNDYGRPYEPGFNALAGFSTLNEWGRFSLYVRGEYQHAPSGTGYSYALASDLSCHDEICPLAPPNDPQDTIPYGNTGAANPFRLQEAVLSFHWLGHEISGGKSDAWLGPGAGGAMAWSNNAEDIYSFRINRIEPMHIPYFTWLFGGLRYDFFVGSLKGHTFPNSPWAHSEMFSLRPTDNFEFSFQRTVIWGGHCPSCVVNPDGSGIDEPVTLHSFLRSFFSLQDTESTPGVKGTPLDPGARYSDFSFSYRLPFLRKYVTLYTDSISHDDVSPISAPRRAAYRPGIYLSQFPGLPRLDLRVEASNSDCSTTACEGGVAQYYEAIQRQGYTNKGFIMGDWVGREAKAGQAWLTYHMAANDWIQLEYLHKQIPQDFIQYGTTQNQFQVNVVKHLRPDLELDAWYQFERWVAPIYKTGPQTDSVFTFQVKFYPKLHTSVPAALGLNGKVQSAAPGNQQQP